LEFHLTRSLEKHGVPREFTTKSRVIIICNDWKTLNSNVTALQDRGHLLVFQPSAAELHRKAGEWFKDLIDRCRRPEDASSALQQTVKRKAEVRG
jgi:hypothetical protein